MRAERWQQIEEIVQLALDCAPQNRPALLDSACHGDIELRREVESLLAIHGEADLKTSLAIAYAALGNKQQSESALAAALNAMPDYVRALLIRAKMLASTGDWLAAGGRVARATMNAWSCQT